MKEIVVAGKNKGKLKEFTVLFDKLGIVVRSLSEFPYIQEPEETGQTFMENALLKARYYAKKLSLPCVADDSGIAVTALHGAPGVYSARYAGSPSNDQANNELLLKNMQAIEERNCKFVCALVLVNAQGEVVAEASGECQGILLQEPLGDNGFGYDPLFYSLELNKSLAQADMQEKNSISHRGKALRILAEKLSAEL